MGNADKVVLVTGASGGIGRAIVDALLREGMLVAAHCRRHAEHLDSAARRHPERVRVISSDLTNDAGPAALWKAAMAWKGKVSVLVNNAGIFTAASPDMDPAAWRAAWRETLQVNLLAAAELCRSAVAHFLDLGGGIIVNVSSRAAFRGDDSAFMHYAASKGGLVALTRSLARAYAGRGILAYDVAPGFVDTPMVAEMIDQVGRAQLARQIPINDIAPPSDVAEAVAFLASGRCPHATGTSIHINGASYVH